jgi:hypothetical protein
LNLGSAFVKPWSLERKDRDRDCLFFSLLHSLRLE